LGRVVVLPQLLSLFVSYMRDETCKEMDISDLDLQTRSTN